MIQLGAYALGRQSLVRLAQPAMQRIVAATGETTYLSMAGPNETAVYIGMVEGTHAVRHTSWVGRSMPFANLAVGTALTGDVPGAGFVAERDRTEPDVTAIAAPIRRAGWRRRCAEPARSDVPHRRPHHADATAASSAARRRLSGRSSRLASTSPPARCGPTALREVTGEVIRFESVSKRYPDGTVAVDELSLVAESGQITVFVGPSGCGKTTSLRMINRMIEPTGGRI